MKNNLFLSATKPDWGEGDPSHGKPFYNSEGRPGMKFRYVPAVLLGGAFLGFLITTIPPYIIALTCMIGPILLIAVDYLRNFRK